MFDISKKNSLFKKCSEIKKCAKDFPFKKWSRLQNLVVFFEKFSYFLKKCCKNCSGFQKLFTFPRNVRVFQNV